MTGMLLAGSTVALSMLSCSDNSCVTGFDVIATTDEIKDIAVSDVACVGVTPPCVSEDDAGACAKFHVVPVAQGNCHVDVTLVKGTTFSTDVKIVSGAACAGFFPSAVGDDVIEVP